MSCAKFCSIKLEIFHCILKLILFLYKESFYKGDPRLTEFGRINQCSIWYAESSKQRRQRVTHNSEQFLTILEGHVVRFNASKLSASCVNALTVLVD